VAQTIFAVRGEEMLHFGLACNLLSAIDGVPLLTDDAVIPKFPGPLPGGVRPGLSVTLRKLDTAQAAVFMDIEYPQGGPLGALAPPVTIGEFYVAILAAFQDLNPPLLTSRQIEMSLSFGELIKVDTLAKVQEVIQLINLQGEGSRLSPEEAPGDLSHYYRFGEIYHGQRFQQGADGNWGYTGAALPMPPVNDMADIPAGGYQQADVSDPATWDQIQQFDRRYSEMLRLLQEAWTQGDSSFLDAAIGKMSAMRAIGRSLMTKPRPNAPGNYGPCFRYVPGSDS
jgi:Ferritin-like